MHTTRHLWVRRLLAATAGSALFAVIVAQPLPAHAQFIPCTHIVVRARVHMCTLTPMQPHKAVHAQGRVQPHKPKPAHTPIPRVSAAPVTAVSAVSPASPASSVSSAAGVPYWQNSENAIWWAAHYWGVDYGWLLRVATCESSLEPWAYNPSGAQGLFQFMQPTWEWMSAQAGRLGSPWNAWDASFVAAWAFKNGYAGQWVCR